MDKERLEMLSDGVFAIVMTILVLALTLPTTTGILTNAALWQELKNLTPDFLSYFASFTVIGMYWTAHHAMYRFFIKTVDRTMLQVNLLYLSFLSLIPFSAHLIALHFHTPLSFVVYGTNLIAISATQLFQIWYAVRTDEIEVDMTELDRRTYVQVLIRLYLTPIFALFGIAAAFLSPYLAIFLFAFPVIFNIIPGSLNLIERVLRLRLPA
jgi:uncharacterized membrane protein